MLVYKTKIVVIGAGQAGLSAAYHLSNLGVKHYHEYIILDQAENAGGAWQYRWPSLTLDTVNRVHDLPGVSFEEALPANRNNDQVQANEAIPHYFATYEQKFGLFNCLMKFQR